MGPGSQANPLTVHPNTLLSGSIQGPFQGPPGPSDGFDRVHLNLCSGDPVCHYSPFPMTSNVSEVFLTHTLCLLEVFDTSTVESRVKSGHELRVLSPSSPSWGFRIFSMQKDVPPC